MSMIAVADNSLGHNSTNHALPHAYPVSAIVFESDFPSSAPRFSSRMKSAKGEGKIERDKRNLRNDHRAACLAF